MLLLYLQQQQQQRLPLLVQEMFSWKSFQDQQWCHFDISNYSTVYWLIFRTYKVLTTLHTCNDVKIIQCWM